MFQKTETIAITLTTEGYFVIESQDGPLGATRLQVALDSQDLLTRLAKMAMLSGTSIRDRAHEGAFKIDERLLSAHHQRSEADNLREERDNALAYARRMEEALAKYVAPEAAGPQGPADRAVSAFIASAADSATFYVDDLEIMIDRANEAGIMVVINNLANQEPMSSEDKKAAVVEGLGELVGEIQEIENDQVVWAKLMVGHTSGRKIEIDLDVPGVVTDVVKVAGVVSLARRRTDGPSKH